MPLALMIIRRFAYFFHQAARNLKERPLPSLVSIATITITLFILGAFLIILGNLRGALDHLGQKIQIITYVQNDISQKTLDDIRNRLKGFGEIETFQFVSAAEALRRLRRSLEGQEGILEGLEHNPLPPSFEIQLKKMYHTPPAVRLMARRLSKIPGVEDVSFSQKWVEQFNTFMGIVELMGSAIMAFLILAVIIIVANTIKLTVYARSDEIEVMRLVGATNSFIKAPFVLEGMIQGFLGAVLSVAILFVIYQLVTTRIDAALISSSWGLKIDFLSPGTIMGILAGGMCLGTFGSFISLVRFLRA
ncbi:MAG: ABC transporter permease [Deltaproteobacteria bacterium]|nr:ABC transporter permease [Deltaproteobacteria bacterium]MBW2305591.1 ABC transporter permease [Deltaproteobacteria bacterium]